MTVPIAGEAGPLARIMVHHRDYSGFWGHLRGDMESKADEWVARSWPAPDGFLVTYTVEPTA
jgi:hypothetical protein